MKHNWQHFIFSFIVQLLLPLMPIIVEKSITGNVSDQTYAISAAMYSISIGVTTKNLALLGASIFVAMAFSSIFGFIVSGNSPHISVANYSIATIIIFMGIHTIERYKRHVNKGELFIDFGGKDV
ncbi:MAG: hypothetical protein KZQ93_13735 [Candidatus Thiodiazotropha sp. (ex Monitilora ramsayi)]|nr:hypothetical protein [Candidatus Thiodiazotropha sp. (ex Monitilora ramsayi)]